MCLFPSKVFCVATEKPNLVTLSQLFSVSVKKIIAEISSCKLTGPEELMVVFPNSMTVTAKTSSQSITKSESAMISTQFASSQIHRDYELDLRYNP
jgi:hypothetical protein